MGKPYSLDLRERIVRYIEQGHSARSAAVVFGVSASTAVRLAAAYRRDGVIAPKPQGRVPGKAGKLPGHMDFLDRTGEIKVGHYVAGIGRCVARCPGCGCATVLNPPGPQTGRLFI